MISIIIPNYNRRKCIINLLKNIYIQEKADFEVIVVDDCSMDGSVEAIHEEFPSVKILVNLINVGPAVTRNRGIMEACGDLIVGFDSDVAISDKLLLSKVVKYFEELGAGDGLAFRILKSDGKSDDVGRWWHPLALNNFSKLWFKTCYFSGTAYAMRRKVLLDSGLYSEFFYMHYEEVELAWRILNCGGEIIYSPELIVIHHTNLISKRREVETFFKARNQILLAISCLPLFSAIYYVVPRILFQFMNACLRGHIISFLRSMYSALKLIPRQVSKRNPLEKDTLTCIKFFKFGDLIICPYTTVNRQVDRIL